MNDFWNKWIIILTITNLVIGYGLVWWGDKITTDNLKDNHNCSEIKINNYTAPNWWLYLFYLSLVFVISYLYLYPGLGNYLGKLNWTANGQYANEVKQYNIKYADKFNRYLADSVTNLARNTTALKTGKNLFVIYCSNCHQMNREEDSLLHYSNLADKDWLWGGEPQKIKETITHGRTGIMPAWDGVLDDAAITEIANYVMVLSGRQPLYQEKVAAGQEEFINYCQFCHGSDGKGDMKMGVPNLTDQIWLHLANKETVTDLGLEKGIERTIKEGFRNFMPPHGKILDQAKIHLLTSYIYSLSN